MAGTFKPLPFVDQNFLKILDPLQTNDRKFSKSIHTKTPENEFLALYFCIFQNIL